MAKLKTPEQKEKERNSRLLRTYGITSEDYDFMLKEQGGVCKICSGDGGERSLHVDHDHKWKSLKLTTRKDVVPWAKWYSSCLYRGVMFDSADNNRNKAIQNVRQKLKAASVRGLLCWPDNRLLRTAFDQPERLAKAAQYLIDFQTFTASAITNKEK